MMVVVKRSNYPWNVLPQPPTNQNRNNEENENNIFN
jgi:hypothetical protein